MDDRDGALYVGSTTDGAIYRAAPGAERFEPFLPPGVRGRTAATGLKVDGRGRLFVAGRTRDAPGSATCAPAGSSVRCAPPGRGRTLVNDIALTPAAAYVTDSYRSVLYRVPLRGGAVGAMEAWLDLRGTPIPVGSRFGLNGIAASAGGRYLVTVHFDSIGRTCCSSSTRGGANPAGIAGFAAGAATYIYLLDPVDYTTPAPYQYLSATLPAAFVAGLVFWLVTGRCRPAPRRAPRRSARGGAAGSNPLGTRSGSAAQRGCPVRERQIHR